MHKSKFSSCDNNEKSEMLCAQICLLHSNFAKNHLILAAAFEVCNYYVRMNDPIECKKIQLQEVIMNVHLILHKPES